MFKYPKIFPLGHKTHKHLFDDKVEITEKIDGSQFRIHINDNNEIHCGSKKVNNIEQTQNTPNNMFFDGIQTVYNTLKDNLLTLKEKMEVDELYLFLEYLQKPKHNTIEYARIPKNHFYLWGCLYLKNNDWVNLHTKDLYKIAAIIDIEPPNIMYYGKINNIEVLEELLNKKSCLGGKDGIEGIVIKNYNKTYPIDLIYDNKWTLFPLAAKIVRDEFRELNVQNWEKKKKPMFDKILETYVTKNRLEKAIQHLRESGIELKNEMSDLKHIIPEFLKDLREEHGEEIEKRILKHFWKRFYMRTNKMIASWYRKKLQKSVFK